ncbi:CehA/McbA family metallohydrolase [Pseudomaricurvus alkylphenolicus]|jgi:hypothetical protein|uniref:CehA/McbA family metallohydrolase n=1 Tax=Pseudomaricurvus alkylphenolicus TaxID=1306991 RepID=UPI001F0CFAB0|nr:CehA/McbA family metallohydrolase [Pseudomaricurvus alkylphenolicus]
MFVVLLLFMAPMTTIAHGLPEAMDGPRGVVMLDWHRENISRTLTAGYPESFGLSSFFGRVKPTIKTVGGKRCVHANFIGFDVDDNFAFDIDEPVELELLLHQPNQTTLVYGYDANGKANATGSQVLSPKAEEGTWQTVKFTLDRARFANRGMRGTDFAVTTLSTIAPGSEHEDSTLTLCDLTLTRSGQNPEGVSNPEGSLQEASLELRIVESGSRHPTPVRMGIYDASGRALLPSEDALPLQYYETEIRQYALKSFNERSQPWPHTNRYVFYSDGSYRTSLPAGDYWIVASKGPEYRWLLQRIQVKPGEQVVKQFTITRWEDMPQKGWQSGDVHIHMRRDHQDNPDIARVMAAEDVHIANLLLMNNPGGSHYPQYAYGGEGFYQQGIHALVPGIEGPRTAQRGHTISLNIEKPLINPDRYFYYHEFFEGYRRQNAISGYAHVGSEEFNGSWGLALDAPFGLVDFVEIMQNSQLRTELWYEFLDLGFRVAPAAGSDFPYFDQPGAVRSYARVTLSDNTHKWFESVKSGETFVSNGLLIDLEVNGQAMGSTLPVDESGVLDILADAWVNPDWDSLERLELVYCGDVIASRNGGTEPTTRLRLEKSLSPGASGWLALRGFGKNFAMAHSAPIYLVDRSGNSACKDRVPQRVAAMKHRLKQLSEAPLNVQRELEYWQTQQLQEQYQRQRSGLESRIEKALEVYERILNRK